MGKNQNAPTGQTPTETEVVMPETYYNFPLTPNDGDIINLTFDNDGRGGDDIHNTVDAGQVNFVQMTGWSPINREVQTSGTTHSIARVFPQSRITFRFHAPTQTWLNNGWYFTESVV